MTDLLVAISGCGGGNRGPQGIYKHLQNHWDRESVTVLSVDTIPNMVNENVEQVCKIALEKLALAEFDNVLLVGYSMGGAVAARAAHELNERVPGRVKGVALLASQIEGLQPLRHLAIPVLFYHGNEDAYFPSWQIQSIYRKCPGEKRMIQVEGLRHSLTYEEERRFTSKAYRKDLTEDVFNEISDFFFSGATVAEGIISKDVTRTHTDSFFDRVRSSLSWLF